MNIETIVIRLRTWVRTFLQALSIALFLIGVYAIWTVHTMVPNQESLTYVSMYDQVEYLGREVPDLLGSPGETLLIGGIFTMMVGIGLGYRWIISDKAGEPKW